MMIEKYEFVSWDDDSSQYEWKVIIQMFQTTNQFCNGSFSTSQFQQILTIPHVAEGSRRTAKFFISLQWRYRFCPVVWLLFTNGCNGIAGGFSESGTPIFLFQKPAHPPSRSQ